jgi:hypothetical protein
MGGDVWFGWEGITRNPKVEKEGLDNTEMQLGSERMCLLCGKVNPLEQVECQAILEVCLMTVSRQ